MKNLILLFSLLISWTSFGQSWTSLGDIPAPYWGRNHPITFSIDGYGYVVTGGGASYYDDFWRFDPDLETWEQLDDFPGPARGFGYGVENNGLGYAGFGVEDDGAPTVFDDWYSYDPVSETWTTLASCPCEARFHPAMVATGDKIYVGLGANFSGDLQDWWEYDIATDTWTERQIFPASERHHPYMFGLDGKAYVGFGHHLSEIFNDFYMYDPATDSWSAIADLPAEGRVAGTQFSYGGKGYVLSGQGDDHDYMADGEFWEYDPDLDSWTELTSHPGGSRWAPGSFVIGNKAYMISGRSNIGIDENDVWVYDFPVVAGLEDTDQSEISIYPNPSGGEVLIQAEGYETAAILDVQGQLVMQLDGVNGKHDFSLLTAGVYILKLNSDQKTETRRLVIE